MTIGLIVLLVFILSLEILISQRYSEYLQVARQYAMKIKGEIFVGTCNHDTYKFVFSTSCVFNNYFEAFFKSFVNWSLQRTDNTLLFKEF